MPRPRGVKKTLSEKIAEKEQNILDLTEKLAKEKAELKLLQDEYKEKQMGQLLNILEQNNLSIEMAEEILQDHLYGQAVKSPREDEDQDNDKE